MRFTLFKYRAFEVNDPETLVEAYCFQSNFYAKYDLQRPEGDKSYEYVRFIGARIEKSILDECKTEINRYKDFSMFKLDLDSFLCKHTQEVRDQLVSRLSECIRKLDSIPGVGLSKATKILHTRYPKIIPIIDNPLQNEYKLLRSNRAHAKKGDLNQLFKDYYDNFLMEKTYDNLCEVHRNLLHLNLSKVRVFDILWWSFLKSKNIDKIIGWTTIRQVK